MPETLIVEGYGEAAPVMGTVMDVELVNEEVPEGAGVTLSTKESLELKGPSVTASVIVASPICPGAGVTVTVRLEPEPPKTIPELGTRVGLEELALNCKFNGAISRSAIVKAIGPIGRS
jgi:hypothetical protein